eukprot:1183141-Prorocentrum_minimum.AAC.3
MGAADAAHKIVVSGLALVTVTSAVWFGDSLYRGFSFHSALAKQKKESEALAQSASNGLYGSRVLALSRVWGPLVHQPRLLRRSRPVSPQVPPSALAKPIAPGALTRITAYPACAPAGKVGET